MNAIMGPSPIQTPKSKVVFQIVDLENVGQGHRDDGYRKSENQICLITVLAHH